MNGVIVLKHEIKKLFCLLLCAVLIFSSALPSFAAVSYPEGVTQETALESIDKTDTLIKNALYSAEKKTLSQLIYSMLFSDETLSSLLTGVYTAFESEDFSFSSLGIETTPRAVASHLTDYPQICAKLDSYSSWAEVDLTSLSWGVKSKDAFATAVSAMFGPFEKLLYALLCSGSYSMGLLAIDGNDGYQNGIVPMLTALSCTQIKDNASFKQEASSDFTSMVKNIVLSACSALDEIAAAPASRLSEIMPNLAYYLKNGGFNQSIEALISPLRVKIANLIPIMSGSTLLSFIENSEQFTSDFTSDPDKAIADMLSQSSIKIANIDLETLASCGTVNAGKVTADKAQSFTAIFTWLIETVKLNKDLLVSEMSKSEETKSLTGVLDSLFAKSTDELFALIVKLLTKTQGDELSFQWQTPQFTQTAVSYTQNLGKEKYQRVLDGIDELLNEFVVEYSDEKSLQSTLKKEIYSPTVLNELIIGIYSAFESDEMKDVLSMIGIKVKPYEVASLITESQYKKVNSTLYHTGSWKALKADSLNWGFSKGNKEAFEKALTAALRPLLPVVKMLLAADSIQIFSAINICGSNGYNTAVIPLLEAIGCPSDKILTYQQYKDSISGDGAILNILEPIMALIDEIIEKPIYTLTRILPNIIFFIENGSLSQCITNLIAPLTNTLSEFSIDLSSLGVDMSSLQNTDIIGEIEKEVPNMIVDIKLPEPNISSLATLGTLEAVTSKAVYGDTFAQTSYVKADQTAVLITLLRYLVNTIKMPENSSLLDNMMGSSEGSDDMFAQYSSGISDQMAQMTTDETIEWLYKLFFRERAVDDSLNQEEYLPTIIYKEKKEFHFQSLGSVLIVLLIAAIIVIINKQKILDFIDSKKSSKTTKPNETTANSQEV